MNRFKIKLFIISAIILILFICNILLNKIHIALQDFAETSGKNHICEILNRCITETSEKIFANGSSACEIHRDSSDRIIAVTVNAETVNKLKGETISAIIHSLKDNYKESFNIPLGTLLGSRLFSAKGPDIEIQIIPLGTVATELTQKFTSVGINQTLHSLYLDVRISVKIASPFSSTEIDVATNVCIAETIIIGDVPFAYLD